MWRRPLLQSRAFPVHPRVEGDVKVCSPMRGYNHRANYQCMLTTLTQIDQWSDAIQGKLPIFVLQFWLGISSLFLLLICSLWIAASSLLPIHSHFCYFFSMRKLVTSLSLWPLNTISGSASKKIKNRYESEDNGELTSQFKIAFGSY